MRNHHCNKKAQYQTKIIEAISTQRKRTATRQTMKTHPTEQQKNNATYRKSMQQNNIAPHQPAQNEPQQTAPMNRKTRYR
jgi:hypothetical protein